MQESEATVPLSLYLELQRKYDARVEALSTLHVQVARLRDGVERVAERERRLQQECEDRVAEERSVAEARLHAAMIASEYGIHGQAPPTKPAPPATADGGAHRDAPTLAAALSAMRRALEEAEEEIPT